MKKRFWYYLVARCLAFSAAFSAYAQEPSVEAGALEVLQKYCSACHGRELATTKRKGNKQMLLDGKSSLSELAECKAIIRGNPDLSDLITRVLESNEDDRMPQAKSGETAKPLAGEDIEKLKLWIAGQPVTAKSPSPVPVQSIKRIDLFRAIHEDLSRAPVGDRRSYRYLTLHNLRNAGDQAELPQYRAAVSKAINSLSSESLINVPLAFGPEKVLIRVDLRDYGWREDSWNSLSQAYPYDITPQVLTRFEREVRQFAGCEVPLIRADWFIFAALQPPFYHQLLNLPNSQPGLPNSDSALEQGLGVPVADNIKRGRAFRAAFTDSGVSDSNRLIERHGFTGGYYWKSYDFGNDGGDGNLIKNPLGPVGLGYNNAFRHDGGETIWSLPNGLQGYFLYTSAGNRLDAGPQGIVKDPEGPQGKVVNGISCFRCHSGGMRQPKGGESDVANTHKAARGHLSESDQEFFDRIFRSAPTVTRQIDEDAARFRQAAKKAGVTDDRWFSAEQEPVSRLYARFKNDIQRETLASELDLDLADVTNLLKDYEGSENAEMNSLIKRLPRGLKRQNFITDFSLLVKVFVRNSSPRSFTPVVFEEFRETTSRQAATTAVATQQAAREISKDNPFVNSLGMRFVPVPGTQAFFSVWETRVGDFRKFVAATGHNAKEGLFTLRSDGWKQRGDDWESPGFGQTDTHPVCGVSWADALAFCRWLSGLEGKTYRLPTDLEWSTAVGLQAESGSTPNERDEKIPDIYPWGTAYPPPIGSGNFGGSEVADSDWPSNFAPIPGFHDGFTRTSPVGSFKANPLGIHDLSGNLWEWCEDWHDSDLKLRVLRGGSWRSNAPRGLLSSSRISDAPFNRYDIYGFRLVLVDSAP